MGVSKIQWQRGTPREEGDYIVTLQNGTVTTDQWAVFDYKDDDVGLWRNYEDEVIAFCLIDSIKPYKEHES